MNILTSEIFKNYLQCKYKAFLRISGQAGVKSDYENMMLERGLEFKVKVISKYFHISDKSSAISMLSNGCGNSTSTWHKIIIDAKVESGGICSHCNILEKISGKSNLGNFHYAPLLLNENDKLSKENKLLLGYNFKYTRLHYINIAIVEQVPH